MKLRQIEVLQGQGKSVSDAVRHIGATIQTYIGGAVNMAE